MRSDGKWDNTAGTETKLTAKGGLAEPAPSVLFMPELCCAETRVQFLDPTLLVLFSLLLRLVSVPGFWLLLSLVFTDALLVLPLHFASAFFLSSYNLESRKCVPSLLTFSLLAWSPHRFFSFSTVSGSLFGECLETCGTLGAHFFLLSSLSSLYIFFTNPGKPPSRNS